MQHHPQHNSDISLPVRSEACSLWCSRQTLSQGWVTPHCSVSSILSCHVCSAHSPRRCIIIKHDDASAKAPQNRFQEQLSQDKGITAYTNDIWRRAHLVLSCAPTRNTSQAVTPRQIPSVPGSMCAGSGCIPTPPQTIQRGATCILTLTHQHQS